MEPRLTWLLYRRATHETRVCRLSDDGGNIARCSPFRSSFRFTRRTL